MRHHYHGFKLTRPLPSAECPALRPLRRVPPNRKLMDADAVEIRRRFDAGQKATDLAVMYDISLRGVYRVLDGETYRDAEEVAA